MWTSDKIPVKNIATNNIICYKVFFKKDIIRKKRKFLGITYGKEIVKKIISLYENYIYFPYNTNSEVNLIYFHSSIFNWDGTRLWAINKGYHSYETLNVSQRYVHGLSCIVECIIPKDAEYYINNNGHIVSSNIIITDKIIN